MSELPPPPPYPPPPFPPPPFSPPPPLLTVLPPEPPRRRRVLPVVIAGVVALGLVTAAVVVPLLLADDEETVADEDVDTSDLSAVRAYDGLSYQHLEAGEQHDYPQSPPVGGDHAPVWLECGAYDEPLPEVNAVHDLEHGATWLTYRPDEVADAGIAKLEELLPANGLLSPYPDQEAPVVITVWGRQLDLLGPDDPRIGLFLAAFGAGTTAPEPFASCNGGVDPDDLTGTGGVAA